MGLGGGRETKKLEMRSERDGIWWEKGDTENEVGEGWSLVGEREHHQKGNRENEVDEGWSLVGKREHRE